MMARNKHGNHAWHISKGAWHNLVNHEMDRLHLSGKGIELTLKGMIANLRDESPMTPWQHPDTLAIKTNRASVHVELRKNVQW
jgi:hypothetical protein